MISTRALVVAVASALVPLAACGGDDDDLVATTTTTALTSTSSSNSTIVAGEPAGLSGTLSQTDNEGNLVAWSFAFGSDGSFRVASRATGEASETYVYDAVTRRQESKGDGFAAVQEARGLGPPDYYAEDNVFWLDRDLGWLVTALARAKSSAVTHVQQLGRPAIRYRANFQANGVAGDLAPDEVEAIIDEATAFPLLIVEKANGRTVARLEVTKLAVGDPPARADLSLGLNEKPDRGPWRLLAADEPVPLTPTFIPDGFTLATRAMAAKPDPTGPEASNPVAGAAFALSYRKGMTQIVVTTRAVGDDLEAWIDPFAGEGMRIDSSRRRLRDGIAQGANAEITVDPQLPPHLWVIGGDHVITITGPLTVDEMIRIAESME